MPIRHWLVAVASVMVVTFGAPAAWAHSGPGGQQANSGEVVRTTTGAVVNTLSGRLEQMTMGVPTGQQAMTTHLTGPESGRAGATTLKDSAIWGNFGYTSLQNDNAFTAYDGRLFTGMAGFDTRPIDPLTIGIAFGYENLDLDTSFNRGTQRWDGFTISPYAVYRFTRNYSVDGTIAYSWLDTDVTRNPGTGVVSGNYNSERLMMGANLNGNWDAGNWRLGASIGYLYVRQDDDPYLETGVGAGAVPGLQTRIGQGRVGGRVGYSLGAWEPYAKIRLEHEFISPDGSLVAPGIVTSPDKTGMTIGFGTLFNFGTRWSGGIEATTVQGRDDQDIWGVSGTIRFRF
jgi:outer membrane autotransporter protein